MGYAQYLASVAEFRQPGPHDFGHPAADSGIDFIEDHGGRLPGAGGRKLDGQPDSGKLAARGATGQRTGGLAGIERHEEFHPVASPAPGRPGLAEPHGQRSPLHRQALHPAGYGPPESPCGAFAGPGQHGGAFLRFPLQCAPPPQRSRKPAVQRLQAFLLGPQRRGQFRQFLLAAAVLAGHGQQGLPPLLHFVEIAFPFLKVHAEMPDRRHRLFHQNLRFAEQPGRLLQAGVEVAGALQRPAGGRQRPAGGVLVFLQRVKGAGCGLEQTGPVGQAHANAVQFLQLAGLRVQRFELADPAVQQVQAGGAFRGALIQGVAFTLRRAQLRVARREVLHGFGKPAEFVENAQLRARAQQRLVRLLPADIDHAGAQLAQTAGRNRHAVQRAARAPVGADDAAHDALLGQAVIRGPGRQGRCGRYLETGGNVRLRFAGANLVRVGALAGGQRQRLHQDGLARAGLPGQRGESGLHVEFGGIHYRQVPNGQVGQHGRACG